MRLSSDQERWVADWWQAHNMRETCPLCDCDAGTDNELVDHPLYSWGTWLARTCRACGHITLVNFQPIFAAHMPSWPSIQTAAAALEALTELRNQSPDREHG